MTDASLIALLSAAFVPFAKGFAESPGSVSLSVECTPTQITGTLTVSAADFATIHGGTATEVDIGRAFRALSSWNDKRRPSLVIESA